VLAVQIQTPLVDNEHRDFGSIFGGIPDLPHFVRRRVNSRCIHVVPKRSPPGAEINLVDRRRHSEGMESEKGFAAIPPAAQTRNRSDSRKFKTDPNRFPESSNKFSCELTFFSYCARIFLPKMLAFWSTASLCGIISFQFSLEGFAASTTNTRYRGASSLVRMYSFPPRISPM